VRRLAAIATVAALALAAPGCLGGADTGGAGGPETLTVYVSAPLHGARAVEGGAVVDGARLALADTAGRVGDLKVRAVYLDDTQGGDWSLAGSAANARRAAEDSTAIGYIGDLDSGATRASLPITNQAQMVQISPASTAVDLTRLPAVGNADPEDYRPSGEQTFARVVPDDDVEAAAAALWAKRSGTKVVDSVNDGSDFGKSLEQAFDQAAGREGLRVKVSRGSVRGKVAGQPALAASKPDAVYFAGSADAATVPLGRIAAQSPKSTILGSDALIEPAFLRSAARYAARLRITSPFLDPALLPQKGQRFVRAYRPAYGRPDPAAAYGYESMALLLDAIKRAGDQGDQRGAVIDAVLSTQDRASVLGTYSIDGNGDTTVGAVTGYRISDGLPVFPVELRPGR
jgi:branched-chain amino acid transport system substrate-binding protein